MNRRLLGVVAVIVLLLAAAGAVITLTGDTTGSPETIDELAAAADQQREMTANAIGVAESIVMPLGFGAALGLGIGLLGGTVYAYQNRGMR